MRKNKWLPLLLLLLAPLSAADDITPQKKSRLSLQDLLNSTTGYSNPTTSVAGVRGLEETGADVDTKARDYAAIDRLDHVVVHQDELQKFVDDGKLQ